MKKTFVVPTLRKEAGLAVLTLQPCTSGQACP
jgi:hypothetical protein